MTPGQIRHGKAAFAAKVSNRRTQGNTVAAPVVQFQVATSDPSVHLDLTLQSLGIAVLPLYMQTWPQVAGKLPGWSPAPMSLCALFSGQSRLTPKVQVLLDFLQEYIGTALDPRLYGAAPQGYFTDPQHGTVDKLTLPLKRSKSVS